MTKQKQKIRLRRQLRAMSRDFTEQLLDKADQVLDSGMVSDALMKSLAADEYLLAKAVIDGYMRTRPYRLFDQRLERDYERIYLAV